MSTRPKPISLYLLRLSYRCISARADFSSAEFSGETSFKSEFKDMAYFRYVLFEDGKKILFEAENLSKVSFMNTELDLAIGQDGERRTGSK